MSNNPKIISFKIFIDKIFQHKKGKISFLCGNGLHNALFPYNNNLFKLTNYSYKDIFQKLTDTIPEDENTSIDPEIFFGRLRVLYGIEIFEKFLFDQKQISAETSINKFLKNFKSIYTLNYDILIYRSFFNQKDEADLSDGFYGDREISIDQIKSRLSNNDNPSCYFLHGAFHLLYNPIDKTYKKITRNNTSDLLDIIRNEYSKIKNDYMEGVIKLDPLVVFASRHDYKYGAILSDEYLRFCLEELEKEQQVFTFGCSFKNDHHILCTLLKGKKKKLYFGFYNDKDMKEINNFISNKDHNHDITYVDLKNDQDEIKKILTK